MGYFTVSLEGESSMAKEMVDPTNALISFQQALSKREIAPQRAALQAGVLVLVDDPNGEKRFTYALRLCKNPKPKVHHWVG